MHLVYLLLLTGMVLAWLLPVPRLRVPVIVAGLLILAVVDVRVLRLPDVLTLPLIAAGLGAGLLVSERAWLDHLIGVAAGYAAFAAVAWAYRRVRSREGLGLGDAKLLAAAGAWLTWIALPSVVLLAALLALAWAVVLRLARREGPGDDRLPFGPALCLAFWWTWLYGPLTAQFS